jgi:hypothetical protein
MIIFGLVRASQAAEKVPVRDETLPQRLKPNSFQGICVRPEGRTLQKDEFFRSLFNPSPSNWLPNAFWCENAE